ncbi:MAG: restriction endonuclease subunit S [Lachnospiraceae bacterium]|nr:restriction endonuclease subunit S [Lachnospiraceae bacterium]
MNWNTVKLADVCKSISDGDHQAPPKSETGIPFVTISNITSTNKFDFRNTMHVPQDYYERLDGKRRPQVGDVLYSVVGSFGIPVLMTEEQKFVFQRHIAILRPDEVKVVPAFLYYTMLNRDFYMKADAVALGAAQRTVSLTALREMEIQLPDYDTQKKVVNVLRPYDELIENNQKQIKLLEEAAQRLYKEWFIDLRFPGYEDCKIVDGVPSGWKKVYLPDIAPIVTGKKDANFGTDDGKYLFFTCSQEPIKAPSYSFDCDAVILAGNGDFNVKLYRGRFEAYQRTYVFSPFDSDNLFLLYYAVKDNMRQLFQGASGSTIKFLTKRMLEEIKVFIPDDTTMHKFNNFCEVYQRKIEVLKQQINDAKEARDRLLPKLMNGEIEV